ncbi:MAG: LysR family transcriptional regulator [Myxococcota bacterium]
MEIDDWDDLRYLLTVAREGTLAAAAELLRVNPTTVSRRIKALQERSGSILFERLRGGVTLTEAGAAMLETAEQIEAVVHDLERRAAGKSLDLAGPIRLTIAELLGAAYMADLWAFAQDHPQITLEIKTSDSLLSLTRREADVALRVTDAPAEHLVGRRLAPIALAVYVAPRWRDTPHADIPWIGWDPLEVELSTLEPFRRNMGGSYVVWADSYMVMMEAMRHGVGASVLPCIVGDREPKLLRLTPPSPMAQHLWVLTHDDLRHSPRVKALMGHLTRVIASTADALVGESSISA